MISMLLHKMASSVAIARMVTQNRMTRRMSRRFVAGETLDDAIAAADACTGVGMTASLDYLGENSKTEADARRARDAYLQIFDHIAAVKLEANVSLKLTQLGLDLGESFCAGLVQSIVERAESYGNFLRIDMEGSPYTQRTIDIARRLRVRSPAVGVVLQAYLYRTERDILDLIAAGCRIRLCKGAYKEPPEMAFPHKSGVDANFVKLMKLLLPSGIYHGIATHDPQMINATKQFAAAHGIRKDQFEFQMLYGISTQLQQQLIRQGYRLRIYIPYGIDWFPYFMRRLAERPANLLFFLRNLFRSR